MTEPLRTDLAALGTTLAVWAHPDDETYLSGGLLAALRDAGRRAVCVTATRGEAGDADAHGRDALARLRTEELEAALAILGVREHRWLDHPDGGCADVDPDGPADVLAALIEEVRADTVIGFGPDGFTGHPDHRAVSEWTRRAVARADRRPRSLHSVMGEGDRAAGRDVADRFDVFALGEPRVCPDDQLVVRLELGGAELDRKVAALRRQHSQTAALVDAAGVGRFAAWVSAEAFADAPGN